MQSQLTEAEFAGRLNGNAEVRALFENMLDQYMNGQINVHNYSALQQQFAEHGLDLQFLGDPDAQSNNKVFKLKDQNGKHSVVLHISVKDDAEESMRIVIQAMNPKPDWANHEYADFKSTVKDDVLGTQDTYHLRVVKSCVPLTAYVGEIQKLNDAMKMRFISDITTRIVDFLDDVRKLNGFFTDLKEGNILVDPQINIQMVDTKSLVGAGKLRGGKNGISFAGDTTPGYTSPSFQEFGGRFNKDAPIDEVHSRMQQEYSYQLGILLHRMATGDSSLSEVKREGGYEKIDFNFNHPVFKFGQGQDLKTIIQRLTHDDPSQRMSLQEAKSLVSEMANKLELKAETERRFGGEQHGKGVGDEWKVGIGDEWKPGIGSEWESNPSAPGTRKGSLPAKGSKPETSYKEGRKTSTGEVLKPPKSTSTGEIMKSFSGTIKRAVSNLRKSKGGTDPAPGDALSKATENPGYRDQGLSGTMLNPVDTPEPRQQSSQDADSPKSRGPGGSSGGGRK